jgi:hypothetical protein
MAARFKSSFKRGTPSWLADQAKFREARARGFHLAASRAKSASRRQQLEQQAQQARTQATKARERREAVLREHPEAPPFFGRGASGFVTRIRELERAQRLTRGKDESVPAAQTPEFARAILDSFGGVPASERRKVEELLARYRSRPVPGGVDTGLSKQGWWLFFRAGGSTG